MIRAPGSNTKNRMKARKTMIVPTSALNKTIPANAVAAKARILIVLISG